MTVPQEWVAATVSTRKECLAMGGIACRKRRRLAAPFLFCNEKTIYSKVKYLNVAGSQLRQRQWQHWWCKRTTRL